MLHKTFNKYSDWAFVFLRAGIGVIFLVHGIGKLLNVGPAALGISNTAEFLASLGFPAALSFAFVVALVETFGGFFILVGLFTRFAAIAVAIELIIAIPLVHLPRGFTAANGGYEFPLLVLLGSIALILSGAGKKFVLERKLFKKEF